MINKHINQYTVTSFVCVVAVATLVGTIFYIFGKEGLANGLFAASIALGLSLFFLYLLIIYLLDDQSTQNVKENNLQNDGSIFEGFGPFVVAMILLLSPTLGSLCYIKLFLL